MRCTHLHKNSTGVYVVILWEKSHKYQVLGAANSLLKKSKKKGLINYCIA